ncbi:MAG: hypothetical protein LBO82_08595 [Synergistaceae bacterium]|jgi:hypothetical protein|nr:hypothetical protein [Synergistaceae bacterium]
MVGKKELVQVQNVERKGEKSFLLHLADSEDVRENALSIRYEDEAGSAIETVAGENGAAIKAITRNIPPEDYTVKLHGAPEGVALGGADINPKAAKAANSPTRVVTYNNTPDSREVKVKYTGGVNVKEAALTLTLEGVSVGTYPNLSFAMKTTNPRGYDKDFFDDVINNVVAAPSALWLPAFTLVVQEDSGAGPVCLAARKSAAKKAR